MAFKYVLDNSNYEDLSSGRVLYNQKGTTAFPVRLASEIFLRCISLLQKEGVSGPFRLYDPLCGGAYLLTALGFLHGESIKRIYASDIDANVIELAQSNLALLSEPGISDRIRQLEQMAVDYQKTSHAEAVQSARRLQKRVGELNWESQPICFAADATEKNSMAVISDPIDIVVTDLPYGDIVQWKQNPEVSNEKHIGETAELESDQRALNNIELNCMLDNLSGVLNKKAAIAVVSREKLGAVRNEYRRAEYFKHGKRHITIFCTNSV